MGWLSLIGFAVWRKIAQKLVRFMACFCAALGLCQAGFKAFGAITRTSVNCLERYPSPGRYIPFWFVPVTLFYPKLPLTHMGYALVLENCAGFATVQILSSERSTSDV